MRSASSELSACGTTGSQDRSAIVLSAARVHFEVRIAFQQILDRHERAPLAERQSLLGSPIVARPPPLRDERAELVGGRALPEWSAQIPTARRVQAQVPHAVCRQPA